MLRKPEILRDYSKKNALVQVQFGERVIEAMTDNPTVFIPADLPVSLVDLTAATNDLSAKYDAYKANESSNNKEAFISAQFVWVYRFNLTADYVELLANSDMPNAAYIITLATFELAKTETEPAALLGAPVTEMEISNNERGCITAEAKSIKGAKGYLFAVATSGIGFEIIGNQITVRSGNEFASFIISTQRETKFTGLPQTEVKAGIAAFNSAGLGALSGLTPVVIP
ncbi:MAG: hypothetical protein SH857_00610 [Chitinophagales bacterium]|nr:hypothetical protein [Chitinophagales bacterium]